MKFQSKENCILSDEEIVELYFYRDERAIKETDIKYRKFLLSVGYNILRDMGDSEECLNDTYIGVWNSIPPQRLRVLQSFIGAIMRRIAVNRYKAKKSQKRIVTEFTLSLSELEDFIKDGRDMNTEFEEKELAKIISDYVRTLSDRQMYIFVSRYYISDPLSKIGEELGCSISTVKREIAQIKKGLKKRLESEGYIL